MVDRVNDSDDFERNEITVRMEPPPQWFSDKYWRGLLRTLVSGSVERTEDTTPLEAEVHVALFPRHPFLNQG